jgi:hypothetical protein
VRIPSDGALGGLAISPCGEVILRVTAYGALPSVTRKCYKAEQKHQGALRDSSIVDRRRALLKHRAEVLALCERHGAYNVSLFGSVARNEARD